MPAQGGRVIPIHRAHRHKDATSYLGIIVFVASWAMLFAALFLVYAVLRIRSAAWPPPGYERLPLGMPLAATLALALSSVRLQQGLGLVRRGYADAYLRRLLEGAALGTVFLAFQVVTWWSLWRQGFDHRSSLYGGVFYLMTVFHALHVLAGLVFLAWLVPGARRWRELGGRLGRLGVVTIYWHFVGIVWLATLLAVYII
jgi:heme/copper-type cytochrome/quinol oxidase subunit 3